MSAPDDPKAEKAHGLESDVVAMKRYTLGWIQDAFHRPQPAMVEGNWSPEKTQYYERNAADRVIATERRLNSEAIAARDARIAELEAGSDVQIWFYLKMKNHELTQAFASRDAEIAEAREIMLRAGSWFQIQEVAHPRLSHKARAIWLSMQRWLTPPSQAPEARRDVGGYKRNERCPHGVAILNRCERCD